MLHGPAGDMRIGGIFTLSGNQQVKKSEARSGETVALARMDNAKTGETLSSNKALAAVKPLALPPVYRLAIEAADRKDEVKVTAALAKLMEEDPSLTSNSAPTPRRWCWRGRARFTSRSRSKAEEQIWPQAFHPRPAVPYKETIRKSATARGRHKRQTGGHGQFGDVVLEIAPDRAAPALSSMTASRAGWCPSNGSVRWKKAYSSI